QYSLAVTYCLLRGGRLPFTGGPAALVAGHLHRPPDLSMLPQRERPVVARALAKEPSKRWPNCRAFVAALRAELGEPATISPGRTPRPGPWPVHPGRWVLAGVALALTGLGLWVFDLVTKFPPPSPPLKGSRETPGGPERVRIIPEESSLRPSKPQLGAQIAKR